MSLTPPLQRVLSCCSTTHATSISLKNCVCCRYVLTQFNSHTLNTHIAASYPPVIFGGPQKRGFVDVLTASQTPKSANWYKGSADAVRQQLDSILDAFRGINLPDELLVLSGQALYRMVRATAAPLMSVTFQNLVLHTMLLCALPSGQTLLLIAVSVQGNSRQAEG